VLGIWIPAQHNNKDTWDRFKTTLNGWGSLKWKIQDPSPQTQFLDLNLKMEGASISFKTFQKLMNLYMYIPPLSAHPSSCSNWQTEKVLDTKQSNQIPRMLLSFLCRLFDRGRSLQALTPLLTQVTATLDSTTQNPSSTQPKELNPL
jgi:hypothetical protein